MHCIQTIDADGPKSQFSQASNSRKAFSGPVQRKSFVAVTDMGAVAVVNRAAGDFLEFSWIYLVEARPGRYNKSVVMGQASRAQPLSHSTIAVDCRNVGRSRRIT